MDSYHVLRPRARRSFIITPYHPDERGKLRPLIPNQCNEFRAGDPSPCKLQGHHFRARKTGPEFPLLVVKCRTHGVAFTLYPPGHVPYGRCPIAPVDLTGEPLRHVEDKSLAWELTIVAPAQDAARRNPWPRSDDDWTDAKGSWRTQCRRIGQLAEIFALTGLLDTSPIVGPLGVSTIDHRDATAAYLDAAGYETRGQAVWKIATELASVQCDLLDLILAAGYASGCWGQARRWNPHLGQLRDVVPRARSP